jgi:hypothetical protein
VSKPRTRCARRGARQADPRGRTEPRIRCLPSHASVPGTRQVRLMLPGTSARLFGLGASGCGVQQGGAGEWKARPSAHGFPSSTSRSGYKAAASYARRTMGTTCRRGHDGARAKVEGDRKRVNKYSRSLNALTGPRTVVSEIQTRKCH